MSDHSATGRFGIGQPVTRFEDPRLLRGEGRFLDDVTLPGQVYAYILRSPHAHARIRGIDTAPAAAAGALAVFTGADLARDRLGTMAMTLQRKRPDGSPMFAPPHPGLVRDRVRYVGDPVAMVVADTMAAARDAAALVAVDYEPLAAVTSTADAARPGSAPVWDECPDNVSNVFETGDRAAADAAFARAARVVRGRYVISRVHAQYM
ncbi:MAG: xanthine dehydrogenase family protein molybdopterin-binding subunit, partial [Candidatus Rokuibacteriota bacterium]